MLRDKYVTYVVSFATVGGLFYLCMQGYHHWLYNFVLYDLWAYVDLAGTPGAHLPFFPRRLERGLEGEGPLGSNGWSVLVTCVALVVAIVACALLLQS